jgi:hypothetical protein
VPSETLIASLDKQKWDGYLDVASILCIPSLVRTRITSLLILSPACLPHSWALQIDIDLFANFNIDLFDDTCGDTGN